MGTDKPIKPAGPSPNKINTLMELAGRKTAGSKQQSLDLNIEKQAEVNGLEMGVLSDGTPFLTGRALAVLCGVHHSVIADLTADWSEALPKTRISAIRDILSDRGVSFDNPYAKSWRKGNATFFAYPAACKPTNLINLSSISDHKSNALQNIHIAAHVTDEATRASVENLSHSRTRFSLAILFPSWDGRLNFLFDLKFCHPD